MNRRQAIAALGLATAGLTALMTTPAAADAFPAPAVTSLDEQNCRETNVARAVLTSGLDPLVPDRYTLRQLTATASSLVVTTYTCAEVSVDGQPVVAHDQPTTVSIGSATVTHRDGQPLPAPQQYILWYGTDNPVLFGRLQQTGLPVSFLPRSSVAATFEGESATVDWAIRGAGLDYDLHALATEADAVPVTSTSTWWHDSPKGNLRITYDNLIVRSTAVITADFTGNELLAQIIALPSLLKVTNVPFVYVHGSWTSHIAFVE